MWTNIRCETLFTETLAKQCSDERVTTHALMVFMSPGTCHGNPRGKAAAS